MGFSRYSAFFRTARKFVRSNEFNTEVIVSKRTFRQLLKIDKYSTDAQKTDLPVSGPKNELNLTAERSNPSGLEALRNEPKVIFRSKNSFHAPRRTTPENVGRSIPEEYENETNNISEVSTSSVTNFDLEFEDYLYDAQEKLPGALDPCTDDVSHVAPYFPPTFNFAAYANKSPTIQELVKLGVDLFKLEKKKGIPQFLLKLDFERDMKPYVRFLHDCGVPAEDLGRFLTRNPLIFKEDLDDLHTRIRYLRAHEFTVPMVARIVSKNPHWLMFSTKRIDRRLGHFQTEFQLTGNEIRTVTTKQPRLITYSMRHLRENTFAIKEEMGFDRTELKAVLLGKPRLWMMNRENIVERFDYAHNVMKLSHEFISKQPEILICRLEKIKQRHMYLSTQNRAQYDPRKPMYVAARTLISGTDAEFCTNVAKTSVEAYNLFLKTM